MSRVSKFVSEEHVPSRVPAPRPSRVSQLAPRSVDTEDKEMTPVTRVVNTGIRNVKEKEVKTMSETEGMSNLRKYNNILVSFIEKARVLAEAEQIDNIYPKSL